MQERWPELRQDLVDNIMPEDITDYFQAPMMVLLSGMLRPTMMAAEGKVFLTSDWSAIEGRVNPWLTNTPAGDSKLSLYRQGIDTYKVAAMAIDKVGYEDVTDEQRQIGKVSELALGFGGGAGAFLAMARGYGVTISRNRAEQIKHAWRDDNPWAVQMWRDVEKAAMAAIRRPGEMYQVGRVTYFAVEDILVGGKTLFCELPCGRLLTYPDVRIEDKRAPWGEMVPSITALRANWTPKATEREWPRAALWGGLLVENITQGTAASLLRLKLREALSRGLKVVLHVHDEIVVESDKVQADQDREILFNIMNTAPEWAEGLPLKAPVTVSRRFSK